MHVLPPGPTTAITRIRGVSPEVEAPPAALPGGPVARLRPARAAISRGTSISRYVILEPLGEGGMGSVWVAFDPDLDRRVAVKLVRVEGVRGAAADEARTRLLREAQALARLSHPNVVAVYDVGTWAGELFVAMELIDGVDLRHWCQSRPPWRAVIEKFVQAGRGLAAVHDAGLVHRDFKPDNVRVGVDGRVRVLDFGIAWLGHAQRDAPESESTSPVATALDRYTMQGAIMGTPAYMAPEQFHGETADSRSDQFAFCVALYEALAGQRPFAGDDWPALQHAVENGHRRPWPPELRLPKAIRRAVERGLALEPRNRLDSMRALLSALDHGLGARRRRMWLSAGIAAVAGVSAMGLRPEPPPCAAPDERVDALWGPAQREALSSSFDRVASRFAARSWPAVAAAIDARIDDWIAARQDACEATYVRRDRSQHAFDARMRCLDERHAELEAVLGVLADADAETVARAPALVGDATPIRVCDDGAPTGATMFVDVDIGLGFEAALARARALTGAGRLIEAEAAWAEAQAWVADVADPAAQAELAVALGRIENDRGRYVAAEAALREALLASESAGHDRAKIEAIAELVGVVGPRLARYEDALELSRLGHATLRRIGGDDLLEAALLEEEGDTLLEQGNPAAATVAHRESLALRERILPGGDSPIARSLARLGACAIAVGDWDEAEALMRRSLEMVSARLGDDHPDVAAAHASVASVAIKRQRWVEAEALLNRAAVIVENSLGVDHPAYASVVHRRGIARARQGRFEEALVDLESALAVAEVRYGHDHPTTANYTNSIGVVLADMGHSERAHQAYLEALEIRRRVLPEDHAEIAASLGNVGQTLARLGRSDEAIAHHREALAVATRSQGSLHPDIADFRANLGVALMRAGRDEDAQSELRAALELRERRFGGDHPSVAVVLGNLGDIALRREQWLEAAGLCERALAIKHTHMGEQHPSLVYALACLAEAEFGRGRLELAHDAFERARALCALHPLPAPLCAGAEFGLARVFEAQGRPEAGVHFAQAARAGFATSAESRPDELAAVDAWLAARPGLAEGVPRPAAVRYGRRR